ncbi:proline dehydrogenase [Streptomyces sp. NPDC059874]|uniref:proline dehydrogenase n=1 Tax=Streptomyces sp. NPDC059874 TaxID=3346983 RepID=UPI0036601FB4
MDAGLTALLGAAVGSLTTLGTAMLTGRTAARSQHEQWRRQHRREAYANYLGALHDRDVALDAVLGALRPESPDLRDVDEKVERFVALARTVHRSAEIVHLEGPPPAAQAADHVARASEALSAVVRRMVEDARAGDTTRKPADTALAAEREHALWQAVKDFRAAAGAVLGQINRARPVSPGNRAST